MIGATPSIHALGGGPLRLVGSGRLLSSLALSRTSAGLALGADGAGWIEVAPGSPRFQGAGRRLLVEGQRTNSIRNPRAEGTAGTRTGTGNTGALPTFWAQVNHATGLSLDAAPITEGGSTGVRLRFSGTTSAAPGAETIEFETRSGTPLTGGLPYTGSFYVRLVAGVVPATCALRFITLDASNALVDNVIAASIAPSTSQQRVVAALTLGAAAAKGAFGLHMQSFPAGTACDFTLDVFLPQLEQAPFASSPILPPVGAPAVATRAADVPSLALTPAQRARGTLVGTFMLPQTAPNTLNQGLLVLDDGTDGNRIALRNATNSAVINAIRVTGGTVTGIGTLGSVTPGTPFKAALAWDAAGTSVAMAGGAPTSVAGAIPSFSRLLVGHSQSDLAAPAFGEIGPLDLHPTRLPDAALQALTAN